MQARFLPFNSDELSGETANAVVSDLLPNFKIKRLLTWKHR